MGRSSQEGNRRVHLAQEEDAQSDQVARGNTDPKRGESLMFNRTLLKIVTKQELNLPKETNYSKLSARQEVRYTKLL